MNLSIFNAENASSSSFLLKQMTLSDKQISHPLTCTLYSHSLGDNKLFCGFVGLMIMTLVR